MLLFRVLCTAPRKPTWDRGWEFEASPLRWGRCCYPRPVVLVGCPLTGNCLCQSPFIGGKHSEMLVYRAFASKPSNKSSSVIWGSYVFPSGALETEIPSTRDFSNRDLGVVICKSFSTVGEVYPCKGCQVWNGFSFPLQNKYDVFWWSLLLTQERRVTAVALEGHIGWIVKEPLTFQKQGWVSCTFQETTPLCLQTITQSWNG